MSRNMFSRKSQRYKVRMPHRRIVTFLIIAPYKYSYLLTVWTYDTFVQLTPGTKYSMLLCHKEVNDGLGIKSTAGLKTFVQ